jgi:NAD(P)-dependent dehydrogenase (short-subunit alcohol dehydrogenase family)
MRPLKGAVAVVTGAANGIGRALALRLAREGAALALADKEAERLAEAAREAAAAGVKVSSHVVDVSSAAAMEAFAAQVTKEHGRVSLLINNAGVALHGTFEEISLADFEWLMSINFWGTVYGVKYFLPVLRRQPQAHIVNLSSVFGIVAPPGQSAYSSSKFAVRGFTEALRHELEGSSVRVSCVHPGGIRTAIAQRARLGAAASPIEAAATVEMFTRVSRTSPEAAADRIVRGILRNEPRILVGKDAVQIDRIQRLMPEKYWEVVGKQMEKHAAAKGAKPAVAGKPSSRRSTSRT